MADWAFLETAPDQLTAEMWLEQLRQAGIAAMIRPSDAVSFLGIAGFGCRVLVPARDLEHAREVLGIEEEEAAR
ncbi:MAG TPA: DUF2007 domain-containing protein [Dehalococcoidia bacterium]|nr:DUF2007 domain-containing protein [Dehalococcoidia bacterium]